MDEEIYWEAQWAISLLEERRHHFGTRYTVPAETFALEVLLKLKRS